MAVTLTNWVGVQEVKTYGFSEKLYRKVADLKPRWLPNKLRQKLRQRLSWTRHDLFMSEKVVTSSNDSDGYWTWPSYSLTYLSKFEHGGSFPISFFVCLPEGIPLKRLWTELLQLLVRLSCIFISELPSRYASWFTTRLTIVNDRYSTPKEPMNSQIPLQWY